MEISEQLTPAVLRRLTDTNELDEVTRIDLSIDTECVTLTELGVCLTNLTELKLTTPSYVPTLRKLGTLSHLTVLWASAVGLENIDGTSGLTTLRELYISYNQITDLSPLAYLDQLEVLDIESNYIESGLELRYLSFCPKLTNLSMSGCPIAELPDYRRIVLSRLPPGAMLDDEESVIKSTIDEQQSMFTADDAILFRELVADGLLDEAELLENEPVTRPFTAMGMRPKTTQLTPFQRPSSAFKRPNSNERPLERSRSDLTQGDALVGERGLLSRSRNGERRMREEMKDRLRGLDNLATNASPPSHEVNILKLDDDECQPIPDRSQLARSIRATPICKDQGDSLSSDDNEAEEEVVEEAKHEPRIVQRKRSDHGLPKLRKELKPLRTTMPMFKPKGDTQTVKLNSSRQEQLLAEIGEYKQVTVQVPALLKHQAKKAEVTQN